MEICCTCRSWLESHTSITSTHTSDCPGPRIAAAVLEVPGVHRWLILVATDAARNALHAARIAHRARIWTDAEVEALLAVDRPRMGDPDLGQGAVPDSPRSWPGEALAQPDGHPGEAAGPVQAGPPARVDQAQDAESGPGKAGLARRQLARAVAEARLIFRADLVSVCQVPIGDTCGATQAPLFDLTPKLSPINH